MKSPPRHSTLNAIPRNSFRRTLLRTVLHNFSALAAVNHLDGISYRPNRPKSRKSFRRLLLPLFVPVTPLCAHSYEKIGGTPPPLGFNLKPWTVNSRQTRNYQCYLPLTNKGGGRVQKLRIAPRAPLAAISIDLHRSGFYHF